MREHAAAAAAVLSLLALPGLPAAAPATDPPTTTPAASPAGAPTGPREPSTPPSRVLTLAKEDTLDLTGIADIGTVEVQANRLSIGEIVQLCIDREEDLARRIESHRYTQLVKSVFHVGGYGPAAKKLLVLEEVDRVSFRRSGIDRTTALHVDRYVLEKGERKPWDEKDDEGGDGIEIRFEDLGDLPFYLEERGAYDFRIIGRHYVEGRLIYQVRLRPRSDFAIAPEGTIWVDTSNFQILREEFFFGDRVPLPMIVRSIGPFVRERERIGDLWVWKRMLIRVDIRTGLLRLLDKDVPETVEFVVSFTDHELNADSTRGGSAGEADAGAAAPEAGEAAADPESGATASEGDAAGPAAAAAPEAGLSRPDGTDGATPPSSLEPAATASEDPLDRYLADLARTTDGSYSLASREMGIRPAAIDSLVVAFDQSGTPPREVSSPERRRWDLDVAPRSLRYNRVEGLNLMPSLNLAAPSPQRLEIFGAAGYGTASEEWTWRAGGRIAANHRAGTPSIEIEHRRDVLAYGSGRRAGNSFTALLLGRDDQDYHGAEGWVARARAARGGVGIDIAYEAERHSSLARETRFHLLGGGSFRPNPRIDHGRLRVVRMGARLRLSRDEGAVLRLENAMAGGSLGGDFPFHSLRGTIALRRFLPWGDELAVELSGGRASGRVPRQALFHLGGFATLRGYEVNEFPAREFLHLRLDDALAEDLFDGIPGLEKLDLQLVPFFDAAALLRLQGEDGRAVRADPAEWRFSGGLGFQKNLFGIPGTVGLLRLDVARRLDRGDDAWTGRILFTTGP
jgi:hypothetical protein